MEILEGKVLVYRAAVTESYKLDGLIKQKCVISVLETRSQRPPSARLVPSLRMTLSLSFCGWEVVSHCGFYLRFPDSYDVEHLSMCLMVTFVSFLEKCSIQVLCPFFLRVVCVCVCVYNF